MKTAKILKWTTLLILVVSLIVGLRYAVKWFDDSGEETPVAKMEPAKIIDIRPMVKLCSVEL